MRRACLLLAGLAVAVAACGAIRGPEGVELKDLESSIRQRALDVEPGSVIDLGDLAPGFGWSDMVVVGPYPDGGEFRRAAGFDWDASAAGSAVDESNVIAFTNGGRVVAWGALFGDVYFLPEEDSSISVARDDARFRVVLEDDGESRRLDHVPN